MAETGFSNGTTGFGATSVESSDGGALEIFGGQLYYASPGPGGGVYAIGTGEPTSLTTKTPLVGVATSGSMVQDCEVCCEPWHVVVRRGPSRKPAVTVERIQ